jgi:hypothetical protein
MIEHVGVAIAHASVAHVSDRDQAPAWTAAASITFWKTRGLLKH